MRVKNWFESSTKENLVQSSEKIEQKSNNLVN